MIGLGEKPCFPHPGKCVRPPFKAAIGMTHFQGNKMEIKKVSAKSRITLPNEFAGKYVLIEKLSEGILQIKTGEFIPDSEKLFHSEEYRNRLKRFDEWMDQHTPDDGNVEDLVEGNAK
jgi:hypothetical protein